MFNEQISEMMAKAMTLISRYSDVPTKTQMEYWESNADRISVSSQGDNMDAAMDILNTLKSDKSFENVYASLTPDERSYITLMLIASCDLKTLREIDSYRHQLEIA